MRFFLCFSVFLLGACGPMQMGQQVKRIKEERLTSLEELERSVAALRREVNSAEQTLNREKSQLSELEKRKIIDSVNVELNALKFKEKQLREENAEQRQQKQLVADIKRLEKELQDLECETFEGVCQ